VGLVRGVFLSYSHADESFRNQLEKQLTMLKRQGVIDTWHDRRISVGENIDQAISDHINRDEIILLLISSDFLASDYCYNIEMKRAMERHHAGEAIVIPVILRACDWHDAPFGKLNATPRDGRPIKQFPDIDEGFLQVVIAVREAVSRLPRARPISPGTTSPFPPAQAAVAPAQAREPRSSNLRITKTFTQLEKDEFLLDTFEFIARFFGNSLVELGNRNAEVKGVFRQIDASRFFATVYRNGKDIAQCTVYLGDSMFGKGICYVNKETANSNTMNESLRVDDDGQALFLASAGLASLGQNNGVGSKLSQEGAAELYWAMLIDRLR
jgi:hypothetical protein